LGVARGQRAELDAARATLEEALAMRRKILGEEHPDVAISHSELGRTLFKCSDRPITKRRPA
jgi:hypothetical protein